MIEQGYQLTNTAIIKSLKAVPLLEQLDEAILEKVAELCTTRDLVRGERLIHEGEKADDFFIVLQGRFIVLAGETAIAEIAAGEPIGEMAFFSGEVRSASVVAARTSQVLTLNRKAYESLVKDIPELPSSIIRTLAHRIMASNSRPSQLHPRPGTTIGIFPASNGRLHDTFITQLTHVITQQSDWQIVREADLPQEQKLSDWVKSREAQGLRLILICQDLEHQADWAKKVSEVTEVNVIVVDTSSQSAQETRVSGLEQHIYSTSLNPNTYVVLQRDTAQTPIRNSAGWLANRPAGLHHQLALDRKSDFERLARFIKGEATGFVFCGGGAFGTAHLGMAKALHEHGYNFDILGGTSMGAAIAGAFAMGLSADEVMDTCDDMFVNSRAMKRLTAPVYSVIEHRYFDAQLQKHYENRNIEDLPLNFYAVATSLTHNDISVQRQGPLWEAVRASTAIPGVFPPMLRPDGEVLIDGALMDNAPLETMRMLKPGSNIVMNFLKTPEWRINTDYTKLPGRGGSLRKLILGKGIRFPGMFSILARAMIVNAERKIAMTDPGQDIIFEMANLKGMGFLDWTKGRQQFDTSYRNMSNALEAATASGSQSKLELLQLTAQQLSGGRKTMWGQR